MTTATSVPARRSWWPQRRTSIAMRLVLLAILLASLTATLIGTLSYAGARRALEREARTRLTLLAHDVAEHLHRELEDRAADITNWAHLGIMRAMLYGDVDKELAQFLQHALGRGPIYRGIACVDTRGGVVAAAGDTVPPGSGAGPRGARVSIGPPAPETGERSILLEATIANPDRPDATIGTVAVLLDRRRLLDIVEASYPGGMRPLLSVRSSTGDVVLATTGLPAAGTLLQGIAPVASLADADSPGLEVQLAEPAEVALAGVIQLRARLFKVGLLVLAVSSVVGAVVAWRITVPIGRLTDTVRGITARGRLEDDVELPRAGGEVGVLADAFRSMMESLRAAQAEALVQSRRAFLGEIAANIAHEVRTPLAVLKTSAQLLARQELPAPEQRQLATNVAAEVDRLNGVVTNLVDLARPRPVRYRRESLAAIVERAVVFFAPQARRLGVEIAQRPGDRSLDVHGSADQLYQVMLNVIQNALQAMAGPGRVGIRCYRDDGWGVIEVEDTGPGFSPDALARAFSSFASTKADGTGLGLAISKRIVEEHGGTMAVENGAVRGARVLIRVPHHPEGA